MQAEIVDESDVVVDNVSRKPVEVRASVPSSTLFVVSAAALLLAAVVVVVVVMLKAVVVIVFLLLQVWCVDCGLCRLIGSFRSGMCIEGERAILEVLRRSFQLIGSS